MSIDPEAKVVAPRWAQLATEKQLQRAVMDVARITAWMAYHTQDSRRSEPGFPDCIFVRGGRMVIAELKTETGKVTKAQTAWLDAMRQVPGVEVYIWRPSDWDTIMRVLRRT